jgi:YHS domain-containing protein/predicted small metal-binding protein
MAKVLNCGDVLPPCRARIEGATEQEVMTKEAAHAMQAHGLSELEPGLQQKIVAAIRDRRPTERSPGEGTETGWPGGGRGRREEVGRTGIWPASGPLPPGEARLVGQEELGQGTRGAAGYQESGGSELIVTRTDPVCGAEVNPEHGEATDYDGATYYFDSPACKREFEQSPQRYTQRPANTAS